MATKILKPCYFFLSIENFQMKVSIEKKGTREVLSSISIGKIWMWGGWRVLSIGMSIQPNRLPKDLCQCSMRAEGYTLFSLFQLMILLLLRKGAWENSLELAWGKVAAKSEVRTVCGHCACEPPASGARVAQTLTRSMSVVCGIYWERSGQYKTAYLPEAYNIAVEARSDPQASLTLAAVGFNAFGGGTTEKALKTMELP